MQAFSTTSSQNNNDINWYLDIGATNHVTLELENLNLHSDGYIDTDQLHVGNGQGLTISNTGSSKLIYPNASFLLTNLLHVPQIKKNLLSFSQFTRDNNVYFEFHPSFFFFF
jgi:hypothetical protein